MYYRREENKRKFIYLDWRGIAVKKEETQTRVGHGWDLNPGRAVY